MDPTLEPAVIACCVVSAVSWLLSVMTREYSWVDRLWSVLPPGYVLYFAIQGGFPPRLIVMTILAWAWGARLTFNLWRKGGYGRKSEDYRWAELRKRMSPALFQVFNVVFVAAFQNAILLALALPAWAAGRKPEAPFGALDVVASLLFLVFLVGESIADNQQWHFQVAKRARGGAGDPFLRGGLFRYSRHPNFFCEQALWWCFYLFSIPGNGALNITVGGAAVLTGLFQGSTSFTEKISLARYPSYAAYQRTTSRLLPFPPRRDSATT